MNNINKNSSFNKQMENEKIGKKVQIWPQVPRHLPLLRKDV